MALARDGGEPPPPSGRVLFYRRLSSSGLGAGHPRIVQQGLANACFWGLPGAALLTLVVGCVISSGRSFVDHALDFVSSDGHNRPGHGERDGAAVCGAGRVSAFRDIPFPFDRRGLLAGWASDVFSQSSPCS
jgi:hypothetical protein